ncbi:hypothetical protein LCGC14_2131770 [marine sediment metagenome]|uniref:Methyltransferase domain-containing protein n=1 Tax=marine sediment metagenome TaxID=412755 RepID=A0A0F9E174_9ZZZZ
MLEKLQGFRITLNSLIFEKLPYRLNKIILSNISLYNKYHPIKHYRMWREESTNRPYSEFYSECMRKCAVTNPKKAVGGNWDEIGKFQLKFLVHFNLKSHHKLLDFGCGCLRGGIHFIKYLKEGNYYGIDISKHILQVGKKFLFEAGLDYKKPILKINTDLKFDNFYNEIFDFIHAYSVFTHMPLYDIEKCLIHIQKVMDTKTVFFATFFDGLNRCFTPDNMNFYYTFNTLKELGEKNNLKVNLLEKFKYPKKQKWMKITLK